MNVISDRYDFNITYVESWHSVNTHVVMLIRNQHT